MARRRVERVLVTNSDGRLVGSLYRADIQEKLSSAAEGDGPACDCR